MDLGPVDVPAEARFPMGCPFRIGDSVSHTRVVRGPSAGQSPPEPFDRVFGPSAVAARRRSFLDNNCPKGETLGKAHEWA